jgi:hypothetical protein
MRLQLCLMQAPNWEGGRPERKARVVVREFQNTMFLIIAE